MIHMDNCSCGYDYWQCSIRAVLLHHQATSFKTGAMLSSEEHHSSKLTVVFWCNFLSISLFFDICFYM